ncbi:MAG: LLM class flavin-dependent oxidoreductase [Gammaproteobacteria bacterium]|nr:LLM class flavin-dependent oxidoreductase [Gammaproteobacteria bacterium]NND37169.1 LLM class flavin-dependent oxidoreductase [Gammaproteobacteria bacterium]
MRFDVILDSFMSAPDMTRCAKLAEEYGLGGLWIANNFNTRDAFVNFVPAAMETSHVRMGPTAVSPFELHPMKIAHSLLTLNEIARGRAQIVIGGGGGTAENLGHKPHRMVRAVRECIEILNQAIEGKPGSYKGEMYQVGWMDVDWAKQPAPAIYVGANGPQMLRAASHYADAIMSSDFTPDRIRWAHELIDPGLNERGVDPATFPYNNFWAWHVQENREEAHKEARIYLAVRGTIYPDYIRDVVNEEEAQIVTANESEFLTAYMAKTPEIKGVPEEILTKIVDGGVSASPLSEIEREIERMREFRDAGLTEIALCVYSNPEQAIRTIGEHLVPALA